MISCTRDISITLQVIAGLQKKYGSVYTEKNVAISGTHTHSGVGGYSQYLLFDITALGFNQQAFQALVDGIVVVRIFCCIICLFQSDCFLKMTILTFIFMNVCCPMTDIFMGNHNTMPNFQHWTIWEPTLPQPPLETFSFSSFTSPCQPQKQAGR